VKIRSLLSTFFFPELMAMIKKPQLIILLVTVIVAFCSIGLNTGSSELLYKRMNSPFIKFLELNIPSHNISAKFHNKVAEFLNDSTAKSRFDFKTHGLVSEVFDDFKSQSGEAVRAHIRLIDTSSYLYDFLLRENGSDLLLTTKEVDLQASPWSVVVTSGFLKKLGYDESSWPGFLQYWHSDSQSVSLPIAAIVKTLPRGNDLFAPPLAFYAMLRKFEKDVLDPDNPRFQSSAIIFAEGVDQDSLKTVLNKCPPCRQGSSGPPATRYDNIKSGSSIYKTFSEENGKKKCLESLEKCLRATYFHVFNDYHRLHRTMSDGLYSATFLEVHFNELDSIQAFVNAISAEFLQDGFELEAELSALESMKNFGLFSKLMSLLSQALTLLSIVLMIYVISNLIVVHIDRNSVALGTLKALGMSNLLIAILYSLIATAIIIPLFVIGFSMAELLGIYTNRLILERFGNSMHQDESIFRLSLSIDHVIWFVVVPITGVAAYLFLKIRRMSPGDLVYSR